MSLYYAREGKFYEPDFSGGMTKQSFKDSTDINKMLAKAQKMGSISHLMKYDKAVYGTFEGFDLLEAHNRVQKAQTIFNDLPSEVRREFHGDAFAFAKFASDPVNVDRLAQLLPAIARPGSYFPNPVARQAPASGPMTPGPVAIPAQAGSVDVASLAASGGASLTPAASSST